MTKLAKQSEPLKVETWAVEKVVPYIRNPRKNAGIPVSKVKASLKEFGWRQPIVVDSEGVIIVGHTRYQAALELGMDSVPVHVAEGLTAAQVKAYRIADNKTGDFAEWDFDLLKLEFADLQELDFGLDLTGFDDDAIDGIMVDSTPDGLTDPDEVPGVPDEPVSKPGDVWVMGNHRLMCGDSTVATDVERLMNGEREDAIVTDPPYGIGKLMSGGSWAKKDDAQFSKMREWDDATSQNFFDDIVARGVPAIVWGGNYFQTPPSRCWLVWDKPEFPSVSSAELAWTNLNKNTKRIECPRAHQVDGPKQHATQKPVAVMEWSIGFVDGGLIYEPFAGSGTTLVAAEKLGKRCYAMELDQAYVDVAVKRWEDFTGKKAVLEVANAEG